MHKDALGSVRGCIDCDRQRGPVKGYLSQGTLQQINTTYFNELIEVDVMGPLLVDHKNVYIVVVVDSYSGFTMLHAVP